MVVGKGGGNRYHPHLNPPPSRDELGIFDKGEEIMSRLNN
jgi:hypothetical protein